MHLAFLLSMAAQGGVSLETRFPAAAELEPGTTLLWDTGVESVFRLEHLHIERGDLVLHAEESTLVVGHGDAGPVWATVVPDDPGRVGGSSVGSGEPLAHLYLRFHPDELEVLFPPETVADCDEVWRLPSALRLALAKQRSSWQSNGLPVVPPRGTLVLDCGTAEAASEPGPGRRRFYMSESGGDPRYYPDFEGQALPRDVTVSTETARADLERVWSAFDAEYAMFGLRAVDWEQRREELEAWAGEVDTAWELASSVERLVGPLDDRHATVSVGPEYLVRDAGAKAYRANFQAVMAALGPMTQPRRGINWGRTADGVGYVSVSALDGPDLIEHFDRALSDLDGVRGLIVDLRFNMGGQESVAQAIAGRFTERPVVYAKHRFRDGPGHADLGPWFERELEPREPFVPVPTHVLIGPEVMSSAEALALMFQAADGCSLVGSTTAGSTGNPRELPLSKGVVARVPRWLAARPDGTPIEGQGVEPLYRVEVPTESWESADATFDFAKLLIDREHPAGSDG